MESLAAGIFSLLLGIVGLWTGLMQLRNRVALQRWQTTNGKVVERDTYQPNAPTLGPPAFNYSPLVKYVYQVDGREFVNNAIYPKRMQLPPRNTKKWAQKKADSFSEEVIVHYSTADPSDSYLILTSARVLYTVTAVSCLLVLVGVIILLMR